MNKKYLSVVLIILYSLIGFSQENSNSKINSLFFIDLNASIKSSYEYYNFNDKARETSISSKGSFELVYNADYRLLKKISIGGIVGLAHYINPSFSSIKTGLGLKLIYVDSKYHYLTLQYNYHIPFNKDDFREGHQIKIGQVFDIANIFNEKLLLGLYYNYDFFYMENAKPIINNASRAFSLDMSSFGISLGIKF